MASRRSFGALRKLASGKYQASYVGLDQVRYLAPNTFMTKMDADTWLAQIQTEISRGLWETPTDHQTKTEPTFGEYFDIYIKSRTSNGKLLKPTTLDLYKRLARTKSACFKEVPISKISQQDVRDWHVECVKDHKLTSAAHAYKLLKAVLGDAVYMGLLLTNPCRIKGAQNATSGKKVVVPTTAEVLGIAKCLEPNLSTAVLVAAFAGLRFGELTELRRKDVIFSKGSGVKLNIERAVSYVGKDFIVGTPKSRASIRMIPVTSDLEIILKEHMLAMPNKSPEALLFESKSGGYLRNEGFAKVFKKAISQSGATPRITPHGLRHHAASYLAKVGANLPELKEWLGDSSTVAATRYLHSTDRTVDLVNKMSISESRVA